MVVVGLGYGAPEALSLGAWEALQEAEMLLFRTIHHPTANWLNQKGISGQSFDEVYESEPDFESVYQKIVERLSELVLAGETPVYAVPGNPWVAEETVRLLLAKGQELGFEVEVISSLGGLEAIYDRLHLDPTDGLGIIDALNLPAQLPRQSLLITQIYSRQVASEVKLWLMEDLAGETPVQVIRAAGIPKEERIEEIPLYELDRLEWIDHLTSLFIHLDTEKFTDSDADCGFPLDRLVEVMTDLRAPEGCPWDREQTHESLKPYMLEESYEVWEAIDEGNPEKICDELGDLLLQVVFHAQIASEHGEFDMNDVVSAITSKLVRRHPHVFGEVEVTGVGDVLTNWEAIKKREKLTGERSSVLDGVPKHLAGLAKAQKLQSKAAKVGFSWPGVPEVMAKVEEELAELKEALDVPAGDERRQRVEEELGDLLFALANLARYTDTHAEVALDSSISKFQRRFRWIEDQLVKQGQQMKDMPLAELLDWWHKAKDETL